MTLLILLITLVSNRQLGATETTYRINPENTQLQWAGSKPNSKHEGGFKKFAGVARIADGEGLTLEIQFDCTTIFSDNILLTQHLKSPDFFSVRKHPTASFKSTRVDQNADGYLVYGELTLLGKSKEIVFPAMVQAGDALVLRARFSFNRRDFGMAYGLGKVDDMVEVSVDVNAK